MTEESNGQLEDMLRLHLGAGISGRLYENLLLTFDSPADILKVKNPDLAQAGVPNRATANKIQNANDFDVEYELRQAEEIGARFILWGSDEYPKNLKFIFDPPLALCVKGSLLNQDILAMALVGSRRCTHYGRGQTQKIASGLCSMGFTVVSGLAIGIDAEAHRGALLCGGRTVAVLGSGLGCIYPSANEKLSEQIVESGALISEFSMDSKPDRWNFPRRNRLISGLSLGVVVVEAARQSGALITARWASEQGREVFAVPGNASSPASRGPHALIRDGAHLVESADDILEELGPLPEFLSTIQGNQISDVRQLPLSANERVLLDMLSAEPKHIDQIIEDTGLEACTVASTLLMLEVKRVVSQHPGKGFSRL